ncbi:hypothetical protein M8C21_015125 [Ambrosia artemisiifolia]|uniref:Uncharacterized protein n=1 Tax=Ambrosia artemisiifolia TaxID=4212 RepID=A0AAD5GDI0_AMBAR|nr:hypothetical protein M8C21_015125 [Ambrosia artemisiifolia]
MMDTVIPNNKTYSHTNNNKNNNNNEILQVFNRQIGFNSPNHFSRRISASQALVKRIDLAGKLVGHEGCVNTIEFNYYGDHLVSGSDDRRVMFWNVATRSLVLSYASGHVDNIFQARIMPFTDDRTIVTSAADGQSSKVSGILKGDYLIDILDQMMGPKRDNLRGFYMCQPSRVRLGQVGENGHAHTKKLGKHHGRVHKLAVEPGSPHIFYSCGEDGLVQHFDLRSNSSTKLFCCSSFSENNHLSSSESLRLNAIVIDPRNPNYFSVGGSDQYARVYDIRKLQWDQPSSNQVRPVNTFCPKHLIKTHDVSITGMSYSHTNCGHIFIWNKKDCKLVRVMEGDRRIVNQVEPHPSIPVLASSGLEKNIKLWVPMSADTVPLPHDLQEIMESNKRGREDHSRVTLTPDVIMHVLRLHRRQAMAYIERRHNVDDIASDEDDEDDAYVLGFTDHDGSIEDGNPSECSIGYVLQGLTVWSSGFESKWYGSGWVDETGLSQNGMVWVGSGWVDE